MRKVMPFLLLAGLIVSVFAITLTYGGVPAPPGVGKKVADVQFKVQGTYFAILFPGIPDKVEIVRITHVVKGWHDVLFSTTEPLNSLFGTDDGKIRYEIFRQGEKICEGEITFKLMYEWEVSFIVKGLEEGTYRLKVTVYQKTAFLMWENWEERDQEEYSFTLAYQGE